MRASYNIRLGKPVSLAEAIGSFAEEHQLSSKLAAAHVVNTFMNLLPESNRNGIQKLDFSNGILRVTVNGSALRNDLQMVSASIMDMINEKLETQIVKKIILF